MSTPRFANRIRSKNALIIGGTSGIGLAVAAALLEQGANVIITSTQQAKLDKALPSLKQAYPEPKVTGFVCNLAGADAEVKLQDLAASVSSYLSGSKLDHLIYTAGDSLPMMAIEDITVDRIASAMHVRATCAMLAVKTFLPQLSKANTSSIVLTSGSIAEKPIPGGWSVLSFIASGTSGLTRQLAADLGPIRVNCVAPGVVDTDLWAGMSESDKQNMFQGMAKTLPTGRVPNADDLVESYIYLIRDSNITGQIIHSNGGVALV